MFWQTLLVAFRHIKKEKLFTTINLIGLTLGITCSVIIFLFTRYELTFNSNHQNRDRIYRVVTQWIEQGSDPEYFDHTTSLMAPYFKESMDVIEDYTRLSVDNCDIGLDENLFSDQCVIFTDQSFFNVFTFDILKGNPAELITDPASIVLTKSFADNLFGDIDPLDQVIDMKFSDNHYSCIVKGVIEDLPANSNFEASIYANFDIPIKEYFGPEGHDSWTLQWSSTFLLLKEGVNPDILEENINQVLVDKKMVEQCRKLGFEFYFRLQSLSEYYLDFHNPESLPTQSSITGIVVMILSGLAILLLAIINFTTFTVGRIATRLNEFGMRKVLGAAKWNILIHYWLEALIMTLGSLLISLGTSELLLPNVSSITNRSLELAFSADLLLFLLVTLLIVVLLSGIYPTMIVAKSQIVDVLKNHINIGGRGRIRKALFLFQVFISILLVSLTFIMYSQLQFVLEKDLGYKPDHVIALDYFSREDGGRRAMEQLRQEFSANPNVLGVSGASCNFGGEWSNVGWVGEKSSIPVVNMNTVDYEFLNLMDIAILEGRNFSPERIEDWEHGIIVNRGFVEQMGWDSGLDQVLPEVYGGHRVIGIMDDFHYGDLHQKIGPLVLFMNPDFIHFRGRKNITSYSPDIQTIFIKLRADNINETLAQIERYWHKNFPDILFNYSFLNAQLERQYANDRLWITVSSVSSFVVLTIGILGLIGLTAMQIARRTKEIGIRKALGGSFLSIITLLSRETALLILTANVLALPIIYMLAIRWLNGFAYRISLNSFYILGGGIVVFILSMITLFLLTYQVAKENPVKALRTE